MFSKNIKLLTYIIFVTIQPLAMVKIETDCCWMLLLMKNFSISVQKDANAKPKIGQDLLETASKSKEIFQVDLIWCDATLNSEKK